MSKANPFWWFDGETVDALRDRLNAAGPGARLEVRVDKKKNMTLTVVRAGVVTQSEEEPLNKSHICPPDCG